MGKGKHKSQSGLGEEWQQPKSARLNLKITQDCRENLEKLADQLNTSITEVIERFSRTIQLDELAKAEKFKPLTFEELQKEIFNYSIATLVAHIRDTAAFIMSKPQTPTTAITGENEEEKLVKSILVKLTRKKDIGSGEASLLACYLDISLTEVEELINTIKKGEKRTNGHI